jgi:hypothetical protein
MKSERLYAAIGAADDELLIRCEADMKKPKTAWIKYGGLAACAAAVLFCVWAIPGLLNAPLDNNQDVTGRPILQWSKQFSAADYFKYNNITDDGMTSSADIAVMPYAESRSFSDERAQLEATNVIPLMAEHPMFDCTVNYYVDGSIYSVVLSWYKRPIIGSEKLEDVYSDLSITAGYQEVEQISDCIFIELDDNGNIVQPAITVTERGGVQIVAEGNENRNKTITFQNESGWYQIAGSWNDSYEPMVLLLDWIWLHPIDFSRFPIEAGDHFTSVQHGQMPEAFEGYIPDFATFGFMEETNYLQLKNGAPYAYEGQFIAHAPEELVKDGTYYNIEGWTIIHWGIFTNPEYYMLAESLGELDELTEEAVLSKFDSSRNQSSVSFTWDGIFITVYSNTAQELWDILKFSQDQR